jgi:hypothetical protein
MYSAVLYSCIYLFIYSTFVAGFSMVHHGKCVYSFYKEPQEVVVDGVVSTSTSTGCVGDGSSSSNISVASSCASDSGFPRTQNTKLTL